MADDEKTTQATQATKGTHVLVFDLERAGRTEKYATLGVGAVVMNDQLKVVDSLLFGAYDESVQFQPECWDEHWVHHKDALEHLKYKGSAKTQEEREKELTDALWAFREKWDKLSADQGFDLAYFTDNNVYDGGFHNALLASHRPKDWPLPYNTKKSYESFWETHSMIRGILFAVDPGFSGEWGLSERLAKVYDFPPCPVKPDHNPVNDATAIAYEAHMLLRVRQGKIKPRKT
jgi:hypothetical protein